MKIACVGYRKWSLDIYDQLKADTHHDFIIQRSFEEFDEKKIIMFKPDLILFYGWSWIVPRNLIENFNCIMLHPSRLPEYRGGSPIQNQIIDGIHNSAVTLFLMTDELDSGPILGQQDLSLEGDLKEIFQRITKIGVNLTQEIFDNGMKPVTQDNNAATYCKRRTPDESENTIEEIETKDAKFIYDKVRMLQSPYPKAFIRTSDGKKLYIKKVSLSEE